MSARRRRTATVGAAHRAALAAGAMACFLTFTPCCSKAEDYPGAASAARVWGNARAFLKECGLPVPSEDAFGRLLDHVPHGEKERATRAALDAFNETWEKIRGTGADDSECSDAQDDIRSVESYLDGIKRKR